MNHIFMIYPAIFFITFIIYLILYHSFFTMYVYIHNQTKGAFLFT